MGLAIEEKRVDPYFRGRDLVHKRAHRDGGNRGVGKVA